MSPPFLRYELPRRAADRLRVDARSQARFLAAAWLALPPADRTVGRLEREAHALGTPGRLGYAHGEAMGEPLGPWLWLVESPGRVFLDVDLDALAETVLDEGPRPP